jgi:ABC-2 type transport system permease protein
MNVRAVLALLRHHWRLHQRPLLPMAGALALFQLILTQLAPAPNETSWIASLLALMPPQLKALAGGDVALASTDGFLSLGYGHPFFLLLLSAWAVRVSSAALAGEIGRGTMDLLGARPIHRMNHVTAAALAIGAGLAVIVLSAWAGTVIGLRVRPLGLSAWPFFKLAVAAWLLFMAWGAAGLLVSATQRESGPAIAWISGLIAVSFVLEYLARLWKVIAVLRPLSLFTYYQPPEVVRMGIGAGSAASAACLAGVGVVLILAAGLVFSRRDL